MASASRLGLQVKIYMSRQDGELCNAMVRVASYLRIRKVAKAMFC